MSIAVGLPTKCPLAAAAIGASHSCARRYGVGLTTVSAAGAAGAPNAGGGGATPELDRHAAAVSHDLSAGTV